MAGPLRTSALPSAAADTLVTGDYLLGLDTSDTSSNAAGAAGTLKRYNRSGFLIPDANADLTLATGTFSSSGADTGVLVGGNIKNATLFRVDHTYTQTVDPLPRASGGQLGVGFLYTGTVDLSYAGDALVGPVQSTGYFGPRGVFSNELVQILHNNQSLYGHGPVGFTSFMVTKNVAGETRQWCSGYAAIMANAALADGGAVTLKKTDAGDGMTSFSDNPVMLTAGSATITATDGSDYTLNGFLSNPIVHGNVTLTRRVAFNVRDIVGGAGTGTIWDAVEQIGGNLTNTVDDTTASIGTQIGLLIPRLTKATTNIGIQCDSPIKLWQDTVTHTSSPSDVIAATGTHTFGTGANQVLPRLLVGSSTFVLDTSLSAAFTTGALVANGRTYKSAANSTARNWQQIYSFFDGATVTADTSADTMTRYASFFSHPTFNRTNSGTLAITTLSDFFAEGPTIGAGATVTTRAAFQVADSTKSGTLTTQYGVDVPRLTAGTTNVGIRNNSSTRLWDDTVSFTANPVDVMTTSGAFTLSTGATVPNKVWRASHSLIVDVALDAAALPSIFMNDSAYRSAANSTVRDLKTVRSFNDSPTITADTSADTMVAFSSFAATPAFAIANAGTLALTALDVFKSDAPAIGSGVTVTDLRAFRVVDATGSGTVTNQYGIDIPRLTKGGTKNVGIRSNSRVDLWDDTVSFTVNPDAIINVNGAWTLSTGTDLTPRVLDVGATLVVDTTLNIFAVPTAIRNGMTYKSAANSTVRDLKQLRSFFDSATVQADTSADTMTAYTSFHAAPIFSRVNSGTLALTTLRQFYAEAPAVGAGVTITTSVGLGIDNPTGSGTITNAYGIDIATISKGGTKNRAIRIGKGGIEWGAAETANDTASTVASGGFSMYPKGNKWVIAFNNGGTIRYVSIDFSANGNAIGTVTTTAP